MSAVFTSSSKCTICRSPVGNSWYISEVGDVFCTSHKNPSFCQGCRHPLPLGATGDICAGCIPSLFTHESQLPTSRSEVLRWLTGHIGPNGLHHVPVVLEERNNFVAMQTGVTNWVFDGQNFDVGIRILRNVTPNIFEHTLAHEYGHVLLVVDPVSMSFQGGFPDHRHVEEEGFCEVVKYLWLEEKGTGHREFDQRDVRNNPDPVYGAGFRMVWKEYEKLGSIVALRAHMLGISATTTKKRTFEFPWQKKNPDAPVIDNPVPQEDLPPIQTAPSEGGSHRPTRVITLKNRQQPAPATPIAANPRPMVTVNFTRRDATADTPTTPDERPTRTITRRDATAGTPTTPDERPTRTITRPSQDKKS